MHTASAGRQVLFANGAREFILEHCDRQQSRDGGHAPIDRDNFLKASAILLILPTNVAQGLVIMAGITIPISAPQKRHSGRPSIC